MDGEAGRMWNSSPLIYFKIVSHIQLKQNDRIGDFIIENQSAYLPGANQKCPSYRWFSNCSPGMVFSHLAFAHLTGVMVS